MSARHQLLEAYRHWRHCTEAEAQAVEQNNWSVVASCQQAKRDLQSLISKLSEAAASASRKVGAAPVLADPEIRQNLQELLILEKANQERIANQVRTRRQLLNEMHQARRNVGRVHRSYVPSRSSGWQSYS